MQSRKWFTLAMLCSCLIVIVLTCFVSTNVYAASAMQGTSIVTQTNVHTAGKSAQTSRATSSSHWTNWSQYYGDPGRFNRTETTLSTQNVAKLHPVWAQSVDDVINTSPVTANGVVYVVGYYGVVGAYKASTGIKLWSTRLKSPMCMETDQFSTPAVDNGLLYVGTDCGTVFALNITTGKQVWSYTTGAVSLQDSLAVANGMVYFGTSGINRVTISTARLYALNEKTGKVAWTYSLNHWMPDTSLVIANNTIYVSPDFDKNQLLAIDATTGKLRWHVTGFVSENVVVANNTVYGEFTDSKAKINGIAAVNATTGKFIWKNLFIPQDGEGLTYRVVGLAVGNGRLYGSGFEPANNTTYGDQPYVYSFDVATGKLIWKVKQESDEYGYYQPILANGVLYFASSESFFIAYSAKSGAKLWRSYFFGSEMHSPPLIANGMLYGTSNTGQVVAMAVTS